MKVEENLGIIALLFLLSLLGFVCYKAFSSDGKVDHCYIDYNSGRNGGAVGFNLRGQRSWCSDLDYGLYPTLIDAQKAANAISCKLNIK
jgi:hypothetical protein